MTNPDLITTFPIFGDKEKTVEDMLASYSCWLNDSNPKVYLTPEHIKELDKLMRMICKANYLFLKGQIIECNKLIYEIIYKQSPSYKPYKILQADVEETFFRMRESSSEFLFSKEEMFHIPFEERQKTSNQRYSLTGYPCLCLGKSIYVCWEELNRPKFENANIIRLKNLRKLNLIDLRMPIEINDISDYYRIPLIVASSIKVNNPKLSFQA